MIKLAVISPVKYLQYSDLGDIDMCLTPLITGDKKDQEYIKYYQQSKRFKILDNGAFELAEAGVGNTFELVLKAAQKIQANEIILTDYLYKSKETLNAVIQNIENIKKNDIIDKYIWHAVAQGSTKDEWLDCFDQLMANDYIDIIGLSKLSIPKSFKQPNSDAPVSLARILAIENIIRSNKYQIVNGYLKSYKSDKLKKLHLLGGDNWLAYELNQLKKYPFIRSVDSSMPVWYGFNNALIDPSSGKFNKILEKVNLFTTKDLTEQQNKNIFCNIDIIKQFKR